MFSNFKLKSYLSKVDGDVDFWRRQRALQAKWSVFWRLNIKMIFEKIVKARALQLFRLRAADGGLLFGDFVALFHFFSGGCVGEVHGFRPVVLVFQVRYSFPDFSRDRAI